MKIIKDYSYIQDLDSLLAEHGYGEISFHSLNFGRYYNEEEKEENRRIAASLSKDEWNIHCEEVSKALEEPLKSTSLQSKKAVWSTTGRTGTCFTGQIKDGTIKIT